MADSFPAPMTQSMKFQFVLGDVKLSTSEAEGSMSLKWTRGPRTASAPPVQAQNGQFHWTSTSAPLILLTTLYKKRGKFQDKKSKVTLKQVKENKTVRTFGVVNINLANYVSMGETKRELELSLSRCTDKKAVLRCTISSRWLKELQGTHDDTASTFSAFESLNEQDIEPPEPVSHSSQGTSLHPSSASSSSSHQNPLSPFSLVSRSNGPTTSSTPAASSLPSSSLSSPAPSQDSTRLDMSRMKKQISAQTEQIVQLDCQVDDLTSKLTSEKKSNDRLRSEVSKLKSELEHLQLRHDSIASTTKDDGQDNNDNNQNDSPQNSLILSLREENKRLQQQLDNKAVEMDKQEEDFGHEKNKLQNIIADIRSSLDQKIEKLRIMHVIRQELSDKKEQVRVLENKVESITVSLQAEKKKREDLVKKSTAQESALQGEIEKLRERQLAFDDIKSDAKAKKQKGNFDEIEALQKRVAYYEEQLRQADETLTEAKRSFQMTSTVLSEQVESTTRELVIAKMNYAMIQEEHGQTQYKLLKTKKRADKLERTCEKLSEVYSKIEVDLSNSLVGNKTLQDEIQQLKEMVEQRSKEAEQQQQTIRILKESLEKYKRKVRY